MIELGNRPRTSDDGHSTHSSQEQEKTELLVGKRFDNYRIEQKKYFSTVPLKRKAHETYLAETLAKKQPSYMVGLDASRPWMIYWCLNALDLLGKNDIIEKHSVQIIHLLKKCQHPEGGFGGGPHQDAHLAPTFAAINALKIIGTQEALNIVKKKELLQFLMALKVNEGKGGMRMQHDGEIDVRAIYCGLVAATHMELLPNKELTENLADHVAQCQRYEGGFAAYPGTEAHGGYTFCALASLLMINELEKFKGTDRLAQWLALRQCSFEGGFQGRTNKLVDGCYSYWQGGAFPLLSALITAQKRMVDSKQLVYYHYLQWMPLTTQSAYLDDEGGDAYQDGDELSDDASSEEEVKVEIKQGHYPQFLSGEWLFEETGLQEYILLACQHSMGGLVDKPGMHRDLYHTCYTLSGLSVAQHHPTGQCMVLGNPANRLRSINPLYGICRDRV